MRSDRVAVRPTPTGTCIEVRVIPRARRTTVGGSRNGRLLVRVTAPPIDQAANEAVVVALARAFERPTRSVTVDRGGTARDKVVRFEGLLVDDARRRLAALTPDPD